MNHTMKQLISLILALAMSVSLCVTVFAEGAVSVEDAAEEQEIIEAVVEEEAEEPAEEIIEDAVEAYEAAAEVPELFFGATEVKGDELVNGLKAVMTIKSTDTLRLVDEAGATQTLGLAGTAGLFPVKLENGGVYTVEKKTSLFNDTWSAIGSFKFVLGIKSSITLQDGTVALTYKADGSVDYAQLKKDIFTALYVESDPALTAEEVTIKYAGANIGALTLFLPLDDSTIPVDKGAINGKCYIQVSFAGKELYTAAAAAANLTIAEDTREASEIVLAETVEVELSYNGEHVDYEALKKQIFEKAVESSTPEMAFEDVEFTYTLADNLEMGYVPFEGIDIVGSKVAPIDSDFGSADSRTVKIEFPGNAEYKPCHATVKIAKMPEDVREASALVLKEGVSIGYASTAAMEKALFENLIDWDNSILPEKSTMEGDIAAAFAFEYNAKSVLNIINKVIDTLPDGTVDKAEVKKLVEKLMPDTYLPLEGGSIDLSVLGLGTIALPRMGVGEQELRVRFLGTNDFKGSDAVTAKVTVNKGKLTLKVNSASIVYGSPIPANLVESSDAQANIVTVYAGATSDIALAFFVDAPESVLETSGIMSQLEAFLKKLEMFDKVQEVLTKIEKAKTDGITVGELKEIVKNDTVLDILDMVGYDTAFLRSLADFFDKLGSVGDGTLIGFSTPTHAGLYNVTAISVDSSYEAAMATGTLLIRMNTSGNKLAWKSGMSGKQLTVTQAKTFDFGAKVTNGGVTVSESSIKYLYTGLTKKFRLYSSSKAPTEAGSYVVTAYVLGGNYLAAPITRTFKIVAD